MSDNQNYKPDTFQETAFPDSLVCTVAGDVYYGSPGMTLRDYFAAHCPEKYSDIEMWSVTDLANLLGKNEYNWREDYRKVICILQYQYADAMIQARKL